jgi:hypothetical protein
VSVADRDNQYTRDKSCPAPSEAMTLAATTLSRLGQRFRKINKFNNLSSIRQFAGPMPAAGMLHETGSVAKFDRKTKGPERTVPGLFKAIGENQSLPPRCWIIMKVS